MEKIRVEVEIEDRKEVKVIEVEGRSLEAVLEGVRALADMEGEGLHVFERDCDDVIGVEIETRKAISVIGHRHKKLKVTVRFEHHSPHHEFSPSTTVQKVLQWAVALPELKLDPTAKAKANLILPGGDTPLPKDDMIGRYVKHPDHEVIFELTLKDFTNG
ncbi:hypothetical protein [Rhodoblastus sp.]|jgi:hypothetical protein|uniref:hypothetical protein n=1 Tax=Rhodoblastus sp. TaxID=1962975 RepID=UPI0025E1E7F6|nr:hypothetical protein [Rhodoblastus sp.]